ncbi:MAG: hypothetical protein K2I71_03775, partial [Helicobacter sp.]|nr:hypothetical protein [Helicobacter sp.]
SAGNEDLYKALYMNSITNTKIPINLATFGSPRALQDLVKVGKDVGVLSVKQFNHPYDAIVQITNKEVPLKIRGVGQYIGNGYFDNTHGYEMYLKEYEIKNVIEGIILQDRLRQINEERIKNDKN